MHRHLNVKFECQILQRFGTATYRKLCTFLQLYISNVGNRGSTVVKVLCYTNRKVAGLIPAGVIGILH